MRERPTLLLLHGGPGFDHSLFKPDYGVLAEVAQVVYLDHRGHGRSDQGDPADWRLEVWADDVRAFCDALGIERPIVFGWSFGGMVAMAYATRHPDHPAKLILQSTMGRLEVGRIVEDFRRAGGDEAAEAARGYWKLGGDLDAMAAYATTCLPLYGSGSSDPNRLSRAELNLELLMDPVRVLRDMDLLPGLAAVRCPTLVIAGEEDPLCGVTPMQHVVDALPADLVRFEQLPNSGHYVSRDDSERFFTLVRDFVAG
jgi:proline iminopeptidase